MKEQKDILAINLASAFKDLLKYWYIIVLSVVIALVLAFFYLKYSTITYNVSASIVLRTETNNNFARNNNDILGAFDFMVQDRKFQNELFFIQSLPLIREVVGEMDVRVSYFMQDAKIPRRFDFGRQNIYRNSPFIIIPEDGNTQPVNLLFSVDILNENRFYISAEGENVELLDLRTERVAGRAANFEISGIYDFGAVVSNEHTSFRVLLNSNYRPEQYAGKNLFFRFNNLNHYVWRFKGGLSVQPEGIQSTLAHLALVTDNVMLGMDFLNNLIDKYIEKNLQESNILSDMTIEHIEHQLGDISEDLSTSERQLQSLRLNQNIMDIGDKTSNIYQQLMTLETRKDEVQRRMNHLRQMNEYFQQYKDSTRLLAPSALGLNDPGLNSLIAELTTLNAEKQRIVSQDQMRNPRLATLNIRIENLKDVISENISFSLQTTRNELTDLNTRINGLNREFSSLPGAQRQLLDIERRFKLNDAIYTSLLERRIQAQIVKASKLPDAKIIEPPRYAGVASPKRGLYFAAAFLLGIAFPSLIVVGKKLILDRLSSKDDVRLITNISSIGSIPQSGSAEKIILNYPQSALAEAFYMLRSNLVYFLHGEKNKVVLVTSSIPGEGKSFSSFNIATSFAFSNSKTVLVEFDLRKPSEVMNGFNTQDIPGVSSYLINKAKLEEIIIKTEAPNLDIIQAGQIPPNPIALLASHKTRELIDDLRKMYDYVVIDTPPYGLLTDSFVLMGYADLNVYVTRLGYTKKSVLATNIEDIEKKKINNLFMLINGEKNEMVSYGYGKYNYLKKESKIKFMKKKG